MVPNCVSSLFQTNGVKHVEGITSDGGLVCGCTDHGIRLEWVLGASSRKINIAPSPPLRRAVTSEPIQEEKEKEIEVEEKETPIQPVDVKVEPKPETEAVTGVVIEDGGIVTQTKTKEEEKEVPSTILKIDAPDLEAVQAFLNSRNASHTVFQSNSGSITDEARLQAVIIQ